MGCHGMCCVPKLIFYVLDREVALLPLDNIKIIEYFLSPYTYGIWDLGMLLY